MILPRFLTLPLVPAMLLPLAAAVAAPPPPTPPRDAATNTLVVHEWGTFTSVAGPGGSAAVWRPLFGPEDLPEFVKRLDACGFPKAGFARIRMETPVIYFYAKRPMQASVSVKFPAGLITEWYPEANKVNALDRGKMLGESNGEIRWTGIRIEPHAEPPLPWQPRANHYYAARETDAAPLSVNGQWEKLLFYRGIADFSPPLEAAILGGGDGTVTLDAHGQPMPPALLFENRGDGSPVRLARLEAGAAGPLKVALDPSGTTAAEVRKILEEMLVAEGLYPKEASAMVETWKDSWFEPGLRVFYLVPESFVNRELPLAIDPRPSELRRVFVGRHELMPEWAVAAVAKTIEQDDAAAFSQWGRFANAVMTSNWSRFSHRQQGPNVRAAIARQSATDRCQGW